MNAKWTLTYSTWFGRRCLADDSLICCFTVHKGLLLRVVYKAADCDLGWAQDSIKINPLSLSLCSARDPSPAGGAAQVSGPAVRAKGAAAAGPAGLFQEEGRDRGGLQPQPGEAGREVPHQDAEHQGPSPQVRPVFFFFFYFTASLPRSWSSRSVLFSRPEPVCWPESVTKLHFSTFLL